MKDLLGKLPWVSDKLRPKGATEMCMKCRGSGILVHREVLQLREVCSECSGHGDILWIDKLTNTDKKEDTDKKALEEAVICNVRDLLREITVQYSRLGIATDVEVIVDDRCYGAVPQYIERHRDPYGRTRDIALKITVRRMEDVNRYVHSQKIISGSSGP